MHAFTIKECLSFGWNTFKMRPWFFVLVPIIVFLVTFGVGIIQGLAALVLGKTIGGFVSFLISVGVNVLVSIGVLSLYLKAHDNVQSAAFGDLWHPAPFWRFLGAAVLVFVIVLVGTILLIVPGIIAGIALSFTYYLVIERGLFPIAAMKESMRLTRGHRWKLFGLGLLVGVLNIIGFILVFVGLFVTIPVSILAIIHAYRMLARDTSTPLPVTPAPAA